MIGWNAVLKYGLIAAFFVGVIWWVSAGRYDSGYRKGDAVGYARGTKNAKDLYDEQMRTFVAEQRAASEKTLREALEDARRDEEERRVILEASRDEYAQEKDRIQSDLSAALDRLRDDSNACQDRVRDEDSASRVPSPSPAPRRSKGTSSAWVLPPGGRESLLGLASEADTVSAQFRICLRYAQTLKAEREKATAEQP